MATETVYERIQCTAPNGETGCFLIDTTRNRLVSPVCRDLVALYEWTRANGWRPAEPGNVSNLRYVRDVR